MKSFLRPAAIIFAVLLADQALKIWIKQNMYLGQEYNILGNWFIIHFTENNGMAFGLEWGASIGKLALSTFRLVAVAAIGYYLIKIIKEKARSGFITCVSLIFSGAIGNIIDSVFYGKVYGYAGWLQGKVVDMLYFPIINTTFPAWMPMMGGESFVFFSPVFNLADTAISVGAISVLIFNKRYFPENKKAVQDLEIQNSEN